MIVLTIKIKGESATYTKKEFLADEYSISKANPKLAHLVENAIEDSGFNKMDMAIDEVILTAKFEW